MTRTCPKNKEAICVYIFQTPKQASSVDLLVGLDQGNDSAAASGAADLLGLGMDDCNGPPQQQQQQQHQPQQHQQMGHADNMGLFGTQSPHLNNPPSQPPSFNSEGDATANLLGL
jgi:hypothetical protein